MASWARLLGACAGLGGLAVLAGFGVFAMAVRQPAPEPLPAADAIVVLTGGEDRIETGIRLLSEGKGRRLLISGVNPATRAAEIGRLTGHDDRWFRCCIDFGYAATDTSGNAAEAKSWAKGRGYSKLILVTSSYHMPRSRMEFARELPKVQLVSYPVSPRHQRLDTWWRHLPTARLLAIEYVKFLASTARLAAARVLATSQRHSVADSPPAKPGKI